MAYNFEIRYHSTTAHGNADALSRLPISSDEKFDTEEACYNVVEMPCPVNADIIRNNIKSDQSLFLKLYGIILSTSSTRVMKQLARQHVWWPGIDDDIATIAKNCSVCKIANPGPVEEFQSWPKSTSAWERIHIDFAGPIFDSMWLIGVDAHYQFPFVVQMTSTTTENTIAALTAIFAIEGYPKTLVSDNGPQLTSDSFNMHKVKKKNRHPIQYRMLNSFLSSTKCLQHLSKTFYNHQHSRTSRYTPQDYRNR
ncbi:uncharacterized protein LOC121404688 [Drosophila obscura]|uniref:uncharacterized protein LOC121404688 n=1 Tax=Drosophila obscura TaxID=7282 RepID=UPI001BB24026|nr:uncharacterized protein LOC121404688 [Drosophila obscura]